MSMIEVIICHILCIVAVAVAVYCIFDFQRILKNRKIYDITSSDCNKLSCSWAYMKLVESNLEKRMDGSSVEEYLEKMNNFRKYVGLPLLTKEQIKLKLSDI